MKNNQDSISLITVCKNEDVSLIRTLCSLRRAFAKWRCVEYIIVDGSDCDIHKLLYNFLSTRQPNESFCVITGQNDGIYPAMNVGIRAAKYPRMAFFNARDLVFGLIPPVQFDICSLLPVAYAKNGVLKFLGIKEFHEGTRYCHQGILFNNPERKIFNVKYKIVADCIFINEFWEKNKSPPLQTNKAIVYYDNNGYSKKNWFKRDAELFMMYCREHNLYFSGRFFISRFTEYLKHALRKIGW